MGGDAQIGQDIRHNGGGGGGHHVAAGDVSTGAAGGCVHGQEHNDLGVVGRGEAQEGDDNILIGSLCISLICRTSLAADTVSGHLTIFAAAAADDILQNVPHSGGGLLADDLPDRRCVKLPDHVAVLVQLLFHHMGLVEVSAVDTGRLGGDELDGGDVEALTESVGGQIALGFREILKGSVDAGPLALEIHAGGVMETEGVHIIIIFLGPYAKGNVNKGRVAGVSHRLLQRLVFMSIAVIAENVPVVHHNFTVTIEGAAQADGPLLQPHGQGEDLVCGARLIGIVDRLAAPLLELHFAQCHRLLPAGLRRTHQLLEGGVVNLPRAVEVIGGVGGDG